MKSFSYLKQLLATTGIIILANLSPITPIAYAESLIQLPNDRLHQQSKQLQKEIEERYSKLLKHHGLSTVSTTSINDIVEKFIPVGTEFSTATQLLGAAGFDVMNSDSGVTATAHIDDSPVSITYVAISLGSRTPEDDYVWEVKAAFLVSTL